METLKSFAGGGSVAMTAPRAGDAAGVAQVALVGLFVTALATAQLTASKLLLFTLPFELPVTDASLVLPGAALAYALTFFASDCYSELYGRRAATVMVNVAFAMNFVVLLLVWSTIAAPAVPDQPVDPGAYATVLGASTNVVIGSLLAYVLSQNWDVFVFHRLREHTGGDDLWLRNVGSTATSQLLDTVVFVSVAFAIAPAVLGTPGGLDRPVILSLIVGQYLFKLLVAVVDTPFVYAVVAFAEGDRGTDAADPAVR
jgi:uncharacterized integral membrane protein (TIGR00697 family)